MYTHRNFSSQLKAESGLSESINLPLLVLYFCNIYWLMAGHSTHGSKSMKQGSMQNVEASLII